MSGRRRGQPPAQVGWRGPTFDEGAGAGATYLRRRSAASHRPPASLAPYSVATRLFQPRWQLCSRATPRRSAPVMGSDVAVPRWHQIRRPSCHSGTACWPGPALRRSSNPNRHLRLAIRQLHRRQKCHILPA
jgi:hypothetical protein